MLTLVASAPLLILLFVMAFALGEVETEGASFNASLNGWQTLHFLALALVYYAASEAVTGTTLGKMMLGLKVVKLDGRPYGLKAVLVRNVLRAIDGLPGLYLVGIVSIGMTDWKQRVGDRAAGTQVIRVAPPDQDPSSASASELSVQADVIPPTNATWKVSLIPKMVSSLLAVAVINTVSLFLSSLQADETTNPIPSNEELGRLATDTLLEFDRAVQAKDFTSFHTSVSELWKSEITLDDLQDAFQVFMAREIVITGIKDVSPVFSEPPTIDAAEILKLSGYYPTSPLRVLFNLEYTFEDSTWKLLGIGINLQQ